MNTIAAPWLEKYKPTTVQDIHGQEQALARLRQAVTAKKPVLLYGPVGSGKTSSVYALAQELNYEIIEINASDVRNKEAINTVIGSSLNQMSLFGRGKIILVDEVDGIAGNSDRGGVPALVELIGNAKQAVVMTANDPWDSKFSALRKASVVVEFIPISLQATVQLLQTIVRQEKLEVSEEVLKKIARKVNGDLRAAILDLESLAQGKKNISIEDVAVLDDRLREQPLTDALRFIFKSTRPEETLTAFERVDDDLPEALLWVEENIPREYAGEDLARGFDALSKASLFYGRIMRWQHWRFLVYMNAFLTAGISLAKKEKTPGIVDYKRNSRILRYWMAKQKRLKLQGIMQQLPGELHGSSRDLMKEVFPYLRLMLRKNKQMTFGLAKEDISYLTK